MEQDPLQLEAVEMSHKRAFSVVTGCTGKSHTIRHIVCALPLPVLCLAPTCKACQVLARIVRLNASELAIMIMGTSSWSRPR